MGRTHPRVRLGRDAAGFPEVWPQALKSLINLLLVSKQPMFLGWGPERIWLYNDPFIPILAANIRMLWADPAWRSGLRREKYSSPC